MKPVLSVTQQAWMQNAALKSVMEALGPGNALIVGGAVRSAILNEPLGDIDIATKLVPEEATKRLETAGLRVVPTGIAHGTVTAVADHQGFEITTLRKDVETDGRRAVVAFTDDWKTDVERRDFTMNTLLMDMDGHVFDLTGQGVDDLKNGIVRFVGDPDTRIAEDALRILRFFRFHARYGKGKPDQNGFSACVRGARLIENLSRERITQELVRIFPAKGSGVSLSGMISGGILGDLWSKSFDQERYKTLYVTAVNSQVSSFEILLFAYTIYDPDPRVLNEKISKYLILSKKQKDYLIQCIKFVREHSDTIQQNLYLFGKDVTLGGSLLLNAINGKTEDNESLHMLMEAMRLIPVPVFPLKAGDVMSVAQIPQGPKVGEIICKTESWWLSQNTKPDRDQCLDYVKKIASPQSVSRNIIANFWKKLFRR